MQTFEQTLAAPCGGAWRTQGTEFWCRLQRLQSKAAFAFIVVSTWAAAGCGSKTESVPASSAGAAGASSALCLAGDTRTCVGPGACDGGQACGPDGEWSACDCGTPAAGGGTGSSGAGAAGNGGASAQSQGGSGGTVGGSSSGASGTAGAAGSAGAGGLNPGDDPCPPNHLTTDCSGQCGDMPASCTSTTCPTGVLVSGPLSAGLVLARAPSHPGASCTCTGNGTSIAYSMYIGLSSKASSSWHASVLDPWRVSVLSSSCSLPDQSNCNTLNSGYVTVWTDDPDAPSANVVAEPGPCP
jgi:hypothetical protein